jgi:hypothetical protein
MKSRSSKTWSDAGVDPLPLDAPAYRLFVGAPLATVWVAGYDEARWSISEINDRYLVDETTMPVPDPAEGFGRLRRGDLIIWVGLGRDGAVVEDTIWQPALVTQTRGTGDGALRIVSIRDGSLDCFGLQAVDEMGIDWASHLRGVRPPEVVDSSVLDLWQLDVWCRACGNLGTPVRWGFSGPPRTRDDDGALLPWPEGLTLEAGCDMPQDPHLYRCERCGAEWGRDRLRRSD